ncbi:MAG: hypothetical protein AUK47_24120 [Deltaproteobacteria bacterium CG2_30_63_29]|nr:MAG: hypothetical protein AUK47_24120 [Deltaproteobacteria bacterium CG2_30_63_29]
MTSDLHVVGAESFARAFAAVRAAETPFVWLWALVSTGCSVWGGLADVTFLASPTPEAPRGVGLIRRADLYVVGETAAIARIATQTPRDGRLWACERDWTDERSYSVRGHYLHLRHAACASPHGSRWSCGLAQSRDRTSLSHALSRQYGEARIDLDALLEAGHLWVARDAGSVIATALTVEVEGFESLSGLWTAPEWRRKGVGGALVRRILSSSCARGTPCILNVEASNHAALSLYRRAGFQGHSASLELERR